MLENFLTSDTFLYPLYLAIKAAYTPKIWFDAHFRLDDAFDFILACAFLLAVRSGWLRRSAPYICIVLAAVVLAPSLLIWLLLFTWPLILALALRARWWLVSIVFALDWLLTYGLSQLGRGPGSFLAAGMPFFTLLAMRSFVRLNRLWGACVTVVCAIWLLLIAAPIIYQNHVAKLLANQASMQPDIVWIKEPKKGEPYGFSTVNNLYLNDKLNKIAVVIYDKKSVDKKMLEQMHEQGKLPVQMDLYGYFLPKFGLNYDNLHFNDLLAKNNFNFNDLKEYIHSKLQYEINLKTTKLLDEKIIHKGE